MPEVAIVVDSTTNLPAIYQKEFTVHNIPLNIVWDGQSYADGEDISPQEFYKKLFASNTMPTTSQPAPSQYVELFKELIRQGKDILVITLSAKLSGTIESVRQAKAMLPDAGIAIVDGKSSTMGTGWSVVEAARAAKNGASLEECRQIAENTVANTETLFMVDDLKYLHLGGRINTAARFIGAALNFKPILRINDGAIDALERVRTTKKARARLLELLEAESQKSSRVKVGVLYTNNPDQAEKYLQQIKETFEVDEIVAAEVSPVIGIHLGPGSLGLAIYKID